ncbi:NAD-dependent epimerase/dehydratase family protein [Spongiibacter marinus]|uniref:NAD-dependent epimerase/dehydratase family protein n=1 Tax=Spongiibacter marinus TaxID=354246 RepID=UPI0035BE6C2E
MKVLVTGAFGNLGQLVVEQLLADGHQLRCCDLDAPQQRQLAKPYQARCEILLGDITDSAQHAALVDDMDAIVHLASMLPPLTERAPAVAHRVNVDASCSLIDQAQAQSRAPLFIFPSSVTVFGHSQRQAPLRHCADPVIATDKYTEHKLAVEQYLQQSAIPWVIMRVGVSVDARTTRTEREVLRQLLAIHPDTPLEYIHPRDVALAISRALSCPAAQAKTLLLGGGERCQINQRQFINTAFQALGLPLPEGIHGQENFYTHWMDTRESQALLNYQRHSFEDYQQEMHTLFASVRRLLWPLRPILRPLLPTVLKQL